MASIYDTIYQGSPYQIDPYRTPRQPQAAQKNWYQMTDLEQMRELQTKQKQLATMPVYAGEERRKDGRFREALQPFINTLQFIGGVLNIGGASISGAVKQLVDGTPGFDTQEYFRDVFNFKEQVSWRDVIGILAEKDVDKNMWDKKWAQITFGLIADIALDPSTWVGGFGVKAFKNPRALDDLIHQAGRLAQAKGLNPLKINRVMNNIRRKATRKWGVKAPWQFKKDIPLEKLGLPKIMQRMAKFTAKEGVDPSTVTAFAKRTAKTLDTAGFLKKRAWYQVVDDAFADWIPGYKTVRKALNPKAEAIQDVAQRKGRYKNITAERSAKIGKTLKREFKNLNEEQGELLREFMEVPKYVNEEMAGFLAHKAELVTQFVKKYELADTDFHKVFGEMVEHNKEYEQIFRKSTTELLEKTTRLTPSEIVKQTNEYFDQSAIMRMQTVLDDAGIKFGDLLSLKNADYYGEVKTVERWFKETYPNMLKKLDKDQVAFLETMMDINRKYMDDMAKWERELDVPTPYKRDYGYAATGRKMSTAEGSELGSVFPSFLKHKTGITYKEKIAQLERNMVELGYARNIKQARKYLRDGKYIKEFGRVYYTIQEQTYARMNEGMKAIHRKMFFDDVAKKWGMKLQKGIDAPANMTIAGVKELEGYIFDANTAEYLGRAIDVFSTNAEMNKFVGLFDKVMNWWKVLVTSVNPGFHFRNAYGSAFNGYAKWGIAIASPKHWKQAKKIVGFANKYTPDMAKIIGVDDLSSTAKWLGEEIVDGVTYRDAVKVFKETGVISKKFKATEVIREGYKYQGNTKKLARLLNVAGKESILAKAGDKIGSDTESYFRTVGALIELKRTGNLKQAAYTAQEVFVNYQNLAQFENQIGRRVFPFWSWLKQNTVNQIKFVFTQPGRYSKIARIAQASEAGAPEKLEEKLRPEYFNRLGMWQLPITLPDGTPLFFNPDFPFKDLMNLNPVNWRTNILSSLSPFIKLPLELVPKTGYDIFRGRQIERYPGYKAPVPGIMQALVRGLDKATGDKLGVEKNNRGQYVMNPKAAHAITSLLPFVRNTSKMLMMEPVTMDADKYFQWASYMLGIKIKPVDKLTQQYYYTRDEIRKRKEQLRGLQ